MNTIELHGRNVSASVVFVVIPPLNATTSAAGVFAYRLATFSECGMLHD